MSEAIVEDDRHLEALRKQLSAKEKECRQKDEVIKEKDAALVEKDATIKEQQTHIQRLREQLRKVTHPLRDWRNLGRYQKVIQHSHGGGRYKAVAVNSEGLLAVTDESKKCVHLLTKEGVKSIGEGELGDMLPGVAFDPKGNVWVTDASSNRVVKLSQDGRLLQTMDRAGSERDRFINPNGVSISPKGLIYICDTGNKCVTVTDEKDEFQLAFGPDGEGCLDGPRDIAFGSDGLMYVSDDGQSHRVSVRSKEGTFISHFSPKYFPTCIATTSNKLLLITSYSSHIVMVYTLKGELVCEFGGQGADPGKFDRPGGICVDDNGVVYVADSENRRVQCF